MISFGNLRSSLTSFNRSVLHNLVTKARTTSNLIARGRSSEAPSDGAVKLKRDYGAILAKVGCSKAQNDSLGKEQRVKKPVIFEDKGGSAMLPPSAPKGHATKPKTCASVIQAPLQPAPSRGTQNKPKQGIQPTNIWGYAGRSTNTTTKRTIGGEPKPKDTWAASWSGPRPYPSGWGTGPSTATKQPATTEKQTDGRISPIRPVTRDEAGATT